MAQTQTQNKTNMKLKIKQPNGTKVVDLDDEAVLQDLLTTLGGSVTQIKCGFPPKPVDLTNTTAALKALGIRSGETLIVEETAASGQLTEDKSRPVPASASAPSSEAATGTGESSPFVRCGTAGYLKLRVMEDDNSCMFNAVGYTLMRSMETMFELRSIVGEAIRNDPVNYSDAILGQPRQKYVEWIMKENSWGGAIELAILSNHFQVTIVCLDIKTLRLDTFNPGMNTFVCVAYSGIHYDAVALNHSSSDINPLETDQTVFEGDELGQQVMESLTDLGATLQKMNYYTDTASFTLKCNICGAKLVGEKDATIHASKTGHVDFGEYK